MSAPPEPSQPGPVMLTGADLALGLVALAAEIVLFGALAHLARELGGDDGNGTIAAAVVIVLTVVLWARYMAPKSPRRLAVTLRAPICLLLGLAVGWGLRVVDWPRWGAAVMIIGVVLAATQWLMDQRASDHQQARP